ncbi:MAG: hypothetical protein VXU48_05305, partial [Verrucomicrobiota bacterium]|nr:hypothetical protein [Verrucomicrobiota bacterium]
MQHLFILVSIIFASHAVLFAQENPSHLRAINYLYMHIDTALAAEVTSTERLDLIEIMELQLRRGNIGLRTYIANEPELNLPLLELSIDTVTRTSSGQFDLILRLSDHITIDRNREKTVATVFKMRRTARSDINEVDAMKAELRQFMADSVSILYHQNP